ncbi:hypothetical protein [Halorubellus salinus]|uniref:hypothetical protein n=1 Tax=Halorubellus salinus TaxID=755309 RepID=UPI001D0876F8|nr:hypothetical protein [Halorubellus salinus]
MTSLLTLLAVLALVQSPGYALGLFGNPAFYLFFGFCMSFALGGFLYANRANLP